MRLKMILTLSLLVVLGVGSALYAEDDHHEHDSKTEKEHDHHKEDPKDHHNTDDGNNEKSEKHDGHENHDEHAEDKHEDGHSDEEESIGGIGSGNAVTAADEHDGIKLSDKAIETIGLKTEIWDGEFVSAKSIVYHQDQTSVYRLKDGWYKLVPITIVSKIDQLVQITATDLTTGDTVVTSGVALLRVADLDAFSGEVGHSH